MVPNEDSSTFSRISTRGMNRRGLIKTIVAAGGVIVFNGYGRPEGVFAQDKVNLKQWYHEYGEEGTQDAVMRYAQAYTEANPNVTVEVNWQAGTYGDALSAALLTDDAPDVFEQNVPTLDQVKQQQIAPLDDIYTPETLADFNPLDIAAGTIEGKIYWVKMIDDTGVIYYRKSTLEAAGITPPTTLDELIAAAKALDTGRVKGLFVGNDGGISALLGPLMWSAGGDFLTADNKPAFNTPRVAASYGKLKELNDSGALLIGAPTDYWDPSAFIQQLTAMQWTGLWAMPQINREVGDDYGVIPWPASDAEGSPSTFNGGWGECVFGKSKNLQAAKDFVKWLWIDQIEYQTDWALSYGFHVPPRNSVAAAAEPLKTGTAAEVVGFLGQYGKGTPPLWDAAMGTALTQALTNVVQNGADPAAELATAETAVNAELQRLLGS
jgi:multiple sugar transport system substrate-binding protein